VSATFVDTWFKHLLEQEAECMTCPWQQICQGYFKWPYPTYDCNGVKRLFSEIESVANEMGRELACQDRMGLEEDVEDFGSIATS
jgi:sulfatase maturation enzyme AslB (radical SAM superfamily)